MYVQHIFLFDFVNYSLHNTDVVLNSTITYVVARASVLCKVGRVA